MRTPEDIQRRIIQIRKLMELHLKKQAEGFEIMQQPLQISGYTPTREEIERY